MPNAVLLLFQEIINKDDQFKNGNSLLKYRTNLGGFIYLYLKNLIFGVNYIFKT